MKSIATAFLLTLGICSSFAQSVDFDKFEVGIDVLWLIGKNTPPISIFVKKVKLKQKDFGFRQEGYRLRIGGYFYRPTNHWYNSLPVLQYNYTLLIRPGYEWHKKKVF